MSKSTQLAKNTVIIAFGKVFTSLLTFLLLPIYTNFLSASEYGLSDLIITYGALAIPIVIMRSEIAVFRWLVDARGDVEASKRIVTSLFQMLAVLLVSFSVVYLLVGFFVDIPYMHYILFYVLSMAVSSIVLQIARGVGDNVCYAIGSVITGLVTMLSSVVLIIGLGWKADGVLMGMTLGFIAGVIFVLIRLKLHKFIIKTSEKRKLQKELLRFSIPMIPNSLSWWVVGASDRTIISFVIGISANGIYAVANKFSAIAYSLYSVFDLSWSESAALYINAPDRDKFFSRVMSAIISIFGALCIIILSFVPFAFPALAAVEFSEALLYIPILQIGIFCDILAKAYGNIYIAKKLSKKVMNTTILAAIVNIAVVFALIWFVGLWAAAIATAVAYLVLALYRHIDTKKYVKIEYDKAIFVKIGLMFVVCVAFYYWGDFYGNIANIIMMLAASYWVNKDLIRSLLESGAKGIFRLKKTATRHR